MSELVYEGNLQSKEDFVVAQFLCAQGVSSNCFYKKVGAVAASWSLIWSCAIWKGHFRSGTFLWIFYVRPSRSSFSWMASWRLTNI